MQKSIIEVSMDKPLNTFNTFNFVDFLVALFPKNPFEAFAKGNVIQILIISIFTGAAIATLKSERRRSTLKSLSVLSSAFKVLLDLAMTILPIGMFALLASGLAAISIDVLGAMKDFCVSVGISFMVLIGLGIVVIWIYSPIGLIKSLKSLKDPIVVAFSTCSNQATLPFLISALTNDFRLAKDSVDLAIPLGVTMCRSGNAAYYAFVVIFVAALYNEPLHPILYIFIVFGSIIASLAASGASGVISISMLSIILDPLGLTVGSILIVLVLVEPIVEPFRTVTSLVVNAALSCAVLNKDKIRIGKKPGDAEMVIGGAKEASEAV